jgi:hypothetical protein
MLKKQSMKHVFFILILLTPLYSIKKNQQNKRRSTKSLRYKKNRRGGQKGPSAPITIIPKQIIYQEIISNMTEALQEKELSRTELETMYTTSQNILLALDKEIYTEQIKKNNIEENQKKLIEYQTIMKTNQDTIAKQLSSTYNNDSQATQVANTTTNITNNNNNNNNNNPDEDESDNEE